MLKGVDLDVDAESFDDLLEPAQTIGFTNFEEVKEAADPFVEVDSLDCFLLGSLETRREPPLLDVVAAEEYVAAEPHESFVRFLAELAPPVRLVLTSHESPSSTVDKTVPLLSWAPMCHAKHKASTVLR